MAESLELELLDSIKPFSTPLQSVQDIQGQALQQTKTAYVTAVKVQEPRSIAKVTKNVLQEAKLAGSSFYYRWEVKNKTGRKSIVQGPSIDLTMCIARNYGNCALDIEVQETLTHYLFKGVFIDLESGFTVPRLYRQRKRQDIGSGYGDERAEDIVFQIGQSKAQRNAIDKAAPGWLIDQAIEEARQAEINKIKPENLHIARSRVLDFFATYGITQERIEAKLERKADLWTPEDIADLRASSTGLKEGRIGPDELFPQIKSEEKEKPEPDPVIKDKISKAKEKPSEDPKTNGNGTDYIFCPDQKNGGRKPVGVCEKCDKQEKCQTYQEWKFENAI